MTQASVDNDLPLGLAPLTQSPPSSVAVDVADEVDYHSDQCESRPLLDDELSTEALVKLGHDDQIVASIHAHTAIAAFHHFTQAVLALSLMVLLAAAVFFASDFSLPRPSIGLSPTPAASARHCASTDSSSRPVVPAWRLCPRHHDYPALSARAHPPPVPPSPYANLSQEERVKLPWPPQTALPWPVAAYPSVYLLDQASSSAWQLIAYEAVYGNAGGSENKGGWTVLMVAVPINLDSGELYTASAVHGHEQTAMLLSQLQPYITCGDSASDWQTQRANVEMSWHWMKLHCPFARHPLKPHDVHGVDRQTAADGAETELRTSLQFYHPLFVSSTNNKQQLQALLATRTQLLRSAAQPSGGAGQAASDVDWSLLLSGSQMQADPLLLDVCLECVPVVSVALCSAPLLTDVMLHDIRAHVEYHVALGVERVHLFDRFGWYEAALSDYIASGIVDYTLLPLPSRAILGNMGDRFPHGLHWDQHIALEACHMKQVGTAEWFMYKDFDEWLSFPPKTSFIDTKHLAQCFRAEHQQLPALVQQAVGVVEGVVVSLQSPPSQPSSTLSLYDFYQPDTAAAFRSFHLSSNGHAGLYSAADYPCPSPLLAYLTAVSDIRNVQSITYPALADAPTAFRSASHKLPLNLPSWSTSSKDQVQPSEEETAQAKRGIHAKDLPSWMFDWVGLCEHLVIGPESSAGGLMIERFRLASSQLSVNSRQWSKWIARPTVDGSMWVHGHIDQRRIRAEAPTTNAAYDDIVKRPCDEIRYLHYKNFPTARKVPAANQQWEAADDVYDIYRRLQSAGHSTRIPAENTARVFTTESSASAT